ncbi:hypothetical protein [Simiduia agarivorans]|uniref:Lipoprotein n=1 Tax=Simiduia agarivorans (strain DSM 21679 / JCM 13881 / BCRC 17597 / SA1) TaxID=1117647 RepID=K4KLK4_SIMAS|nr:hypothetical protein [Simiduia agarivorans]AFV00055.1 hypothetical protein M5M_14590 [Simiduia agarivorans SA1 = DSM 21679]
MRYVWGLGVLLALAPWVSADTGCKVERSAQVGFQSPGSKDRLTVTVAGEPCSEAQLTIKIDDAKGRELYLYEGLLLDHLPFVVYEPDLQPLVTYFAEKVIRDGFIRTTRDLPAWEPVESYYEKTNDIIIIPQAAYRALRETPRPIFWHAAGDATWVHVVFNPDQRYGQIIMRGGVFQSAVNNPESAD